MMRRRRRTSTSPLRRIPPLARKVGAICLAFAAGVAFTGLTAEAETPQKSVHRAHAAATRSSAAHTALATISKDSPELVAAARAIKPVPVETVPTDWVAAGLDLTKAEEIDGKLVQTLPNGGKVTFTVDPSTQEHLETLYDRYKIPYGGVVLIEPKTGRVKAMLSQSHDTPKIENAALKPIAPSASVFKIITAAALMESERVSPRKEVCYHGGRSRLTETNIKGHPRLDNRCGDLSDAITWSINSLIAKLAYKHLDASELVSWAERFAYNTDIPFELPVEPSKAQIVEDPIERSRTAAGFWNTYLSPMHGAMIGAAVLNDGVMMRPSLIESYASPSGKVLHTFSAKPWRTVMRVHTARRLKEMMKRTTEEGTARKYFAHRREFPSDIITGGKTGTLSRKSPSYLGYTWFVGFGEGERREDPEIAVGGLVCNKPLWHIKGPYAASEAIRAYIESARRRNQST